MLAKEKMGRNVWTNQGKIYMKCNNKKRIIRMLDDVLDLNAISELSSQEDRKLPFVLSFILSAVDYFHFSV